MRFALALLSLAALSILPSVQSSEPLPPWDTELTVDAAPRLGEQATFTYRIEARNTMGNVTVDLSVPPTWTKTPAQNRTTHLREGDVRTLTWVVIPKTEGFWHARASLAALDGGMTGSSSLYGLLARNDSTWSQDAAAAIPPPSANIQLQGLEQAGANVTLMATVTPQSAWMKHGEVVIHLSVLNESRSVKGSGARSLTGTLTEHIPEYNTARASASFSFQPDWQTTGADPYLGRAGIDLGCRELWVAREKSLDLNIERSSDCEVETNRFFAPGPGVAVFLILAWGASARRRLLG